MQPTAELNWPTLMAATSIVGCFLAALAMGYTFFSQWDSRKFSNFSELLIQKAQMRTNLISESNCKKHCSPGYCKTLSNLEYLPEVNIPKCSLCCQAQCCNDGSYQRQFPCYDNTRQTFARTHSSYHNCSHSKIENQLRCNRDCTTHFWRQNQQYCETRPFPVSNGDIILLSEQPSLTMASNNSVKNYEMSQDVNCLPKNNMELSLQTISNKFGIEQEINLCDDPICQREQLKFTEKSSAVSKSVNHDLLSSQRLKSNSWTDSTSPEWTLSSNFPNVHKIQNIPPLFDHKPENLNLDHTYSNIMIPDLNNGIIVPRPSCYCRSHSVQEDCRYCPKYSSNWNRLHNSLEKNVEYDNETLSLKRNCSNILPNPYQFASYATLPIKFSPLISNREKSNFSRRDYKSCLDLQEGERHSFESSYLNTSNAFPRHNSSVSSLRRNTGQFGSRKSVKSVKFDLEDSDDDDSDYYGK